MNKDELLAFLGDDLVAVRQEMKEALASDISLLSFTNDGLLAHPGKQLRPILMILIARAIAGECNKDTISLAAAVEMLHNATLLHDDVADASDERRGRPTVYSILGPRSAVLLGDYWLAKSMYQASSTQLFSRELFQILCGTLEDLSEGEMYQLEKASSSDTEEKDYIRIIRCKTASLFGAACAAAAFSVNASEECRTAAREYADALGIAFQIKDDILDYVGSAELGKPVGIDLREQKITLPLLGALKGSPREEEIRSMVRDIPSHPEYCAIVRDFVMQSGGVQYATARLDEYIGKAVDALDAFPQSRSRSYLADLARYNAIREV